MLSRYNTIIWDWNGTLLNDLTPCLSTINEMLTCRNKPTLSVEQYKNVFGFPVIDYYVQIGFDFKLESWSDVAAEFMSSYYAKAEESPLHNDVVKLLRYIRDSKKEQYILSAMKTDDITLALDKFKISDCFDGIFGLDNHYAESKLKVGQSLVKTHNISPSDCLMIGDTTHDFDVATQLGFDCLLIANGHQSRERLEKHGTVVFNSLQELAI